LKTSSRPRRQFCIVSFEFPAAQIDATSFFCWPENGRFRHRLLGAVNVDAAGIGWSYSQNIHAARM
jgi:hypothetical protein